MARKRNTTTRWLRRIDPLLSRLAQLADLEDMKLPATLANTFVSLLTHRERLPTHPFHWPNISNDRINRYNQPRSMDRVLSRTWKRSRDPPKQSQLKSFFALGAKQGSGKEQQQQLNRCCPTCWRRRAYCIGVGNGRPTQTQVAQGVKLSQKIVLR